MSEPLELMAQGEILFEEFVRLRAFSQNWLARDIEVPAAGINEIRKGNRSNPAR